jgi:hypothetical protein
LLGELERPAGQQRQLEIRAGWPDSSKRSRPAAFWMARSVSAISSAASSSGVTTSSVAPSGGTKAKASSGIGSLTRCSSTA